MSAPLCARHRILAQGSGSRTGVRLAGRCLLRSQRCAPVVSAFRVDEAPSSSKSDNESRAAASALAATSVGPESQVALFEAAGITGRSLKTFPTDFSTALSEGRVSLDVLNTYLTLEQHMVYRFVWGFQGMRERLLADPGFPAKMGIEVGIGICTKLTAEKTKRGDNFLGEIDFVAANVVMALIADWMLTWLPAPTMSFVNQQAEKSNPWTRMFAGCPDNAFQRVKPGTEPYSVSQRTGAIMRNGLNLLAVGFGSSMLGVGLTNALIATRLFLDPTWGGPPNDPQNVILTSLAYGVYMATSSNIRYQIIAGLIEERGIETIFRGNQKLCNALSVVVRTSNTFIGSLLWVDFVRLLGMQKGKSTVLEESLPAPGELDHPMPELALLPHNLADSSSLLFQQLHDLVQQPLSLLPVQAVHALPDAHAAGTQWIV